MDPNYYNQHPHGHPQQGYPQQQAYGYPPQQGYPQQAYGYPPQQAYGYPPQQAYGYPPQQAYGYPQPGYPTQDPYGYPQQAYGYPPQQGYPPQPTTQPTAPLSTNPQTPTTPTTPTTSATTTPTPTTPTTPTTQPVYPPQQAYGYPPQAYGYPPQQGIPQQPQQPTKPDPHSQLSLTTRKSLKENESHYTKALETIKTALGIEWEIEFDFTALLESFSDSEKNQSGTIFYRDISTYIAENITSSAKEELIKEAIIEANTNKKIVLVKNLDKKDSTYWKFKFDNGTLQLLYKDFVNLSDIRYIKLSNITPTPGVYSLNARINLKAKKEKIDEAMEVIKTSTGNSGWTYDEQSLEECYPELEDQNTKDSYGDIFAEVVTNVARNISSRCKDDMVLEAFNEATPGLKMFLKFDKKQNDYWTFNFKGGNLNIVCKRFCNLNDLCHYNWEKLL